jgi:hypothetical protein
MSGKSIQFNRRKVISVLLAIFMLAMVVTGHITRVSHTTRNVLLAIFMLAMVVTPALAWFDEGEVNGQAARPCRVISNNQALPTLYCTQAMPHHPRPLAQRPLVRPALAKAEQIFIFNQDSTEPMAQSTSDQ